MRKLLVGTTNSGKQREYRQLLSALPVELCFPDELGLLLDVVEDGDSFLANARIKAHAHTRATGLWSLADDSGLEVDALDGAPGIHSARYAYGASSDSDRYRVLLRNMQGVPVERRSARFRCALVLTGPEGSEDAVEGTCEGVILTGPRGSGGFGYDPVFSVSELGLTLAELSADEKNRVSHRARAVAALMPVLVRRLLEEG
jgi:XTP/dITP diphosphohydrolase